MCTCEVYTWTEDRQASARRRATVGGDIHGLGTASRVGFARMVTHDTGDAGPVFLCSLSLSLVAGVGSFRPTSKGVCESCV